MIILFPCGPLASQELLSVGDEGAHIAKNALRYYLKALRAGKKNTPTMQEYLEMEFANIQEIIRFACAVISHNLVDESIQVLKVLKEVDLEKGMMLLPYLVDANRRTRNQKQALQLLSIIGNPYLSGIPVRDQSMFFGREDLLENIQESFDRNPSSAIAITGPRRIGKTSLLYQLSSRWREHLYGIHIDLQGLMLTGGIDQFLLGLVYTINDKLNSRGTKDEKINSWLIVDEADFKRQPLSAFADYIENIHKFLGNAHLILLFDEFDLISRFVNKDPDGDFFKFLLYLRALVSKGAIGIITAGVRPLQELVVDELRSSPFFNIFRLIHIAGISRKGAIELIQRPMIGLLQYDDTAIDYILDLSGCLPYHLNVFCERIIRTCHKNGTLFIDRDFIEKIIPELYGSFSQMFSYYLEQLTDVEREILLAAAQMRVGRHRFFTEREICVLVPQHKSQNVNQALCSLELLGIFIVDKHGNYEFAVELLRNWLLKDIPNSRITDDSGYQMRSSTNDKGVSNMSDQKQDKPTITNTTHIGYVAGPTHTGSGDIIIDAISYEGAISTKEDFLAALRAFKGELEVARQEGLPEETYDDTAVEIEAAEREARKDTSKPDRIINRLEKAKALLTAGTGVAAATTSLVETSNKLVPLIEAAIHAVSKIFS